MGIRKSLCKKIMKTFPSHPSPADPHLWEVFKTKQYLHGSEDHKKKLRYESAKATYQWECNPKISILRKYFFHELSEEMLKGKTLLDLGSFTGGRLLAWTKLYNLSMGCGIDINPIFKVASDEFAASVNVANVDFKTGVGEALPYEDNSFDFIVATDVLEHVEDIENVLIECYRVLKKGGRLCIVFPQYLQPFEAHLGMVTSAPALQWFFSGETISLAYNEIIRERGDDANWYKPVAFPLRNWEKLFSLNGTSIREFKSIASKQPWISTLYKVKPILTDGRKSEWILFKALSKVFIPLAHMPVLDEFFLGRVNCILVK